MSVLTGLLAGDGPLELLAAGLIVLGVGYGLAMMAASRREPRSAPSAALRTASGDAGSLPFFVFLMPCLNEERVIGASLQRLLSMPGDNFVIMVIDDGSDDGTAAVVSAANDPRVWLLRRVAPEARQGKGEALNAAIRHLIASGQLAGRDEGEVIIAVVDADGRLDPHAVAEVTPFFADATVGAVQIGVRINNRALSRLARMQDMEFVIYTEVFQRGRRHLGSVGLGGNGQFVRLSALRSLGPAPWTRSLTEDLDLGVRLVAEGWRNEYCATAAVHQQGVIELRRLLRQRSRWFQGHLQSWKLIPVVLRSAPRRARADMLYHLSSPAVLLIASVLSVSFLLSMADCVETAVHGHNPFGWWVLAAYALVLGPAFAYGHVYWTRERESGLRLPRAVWLAHLYAGYSLMWFASGWWAVSRTLRRRTGWAKTERVAEGPAETPLAAAQSAPAPSAPLAAPAPLNALAPLAPLNALAPSAPLAAAVGAPVPTAASSTRVPAALQAIQVPVAQLAIRASRVPLAIQAAPALQAAPGLQAAALVAAPAPLNALAPLAPLNALAPLAPLAAAVGAPVPTAAPPPPPVPPSVPVIPAVTAGPTAPVTPAGTLAAPGTPTGPGTPTAPGTPDGTGASAGTGAPGPAAGDGGKPARAARPRRRRIAVAIVAIAVAAVSTAAAARTLRPHPAQPQWAAVFNGHGTAAVTGSGARQLITLQPERALTRGATHAALVTSTARYRDFTATLTMRTVRQLRHGAAGAPNPWEVGWVLWHYTSNQRFYALTLEPGRWVLSKQDPAYPGGERFLASGTSPGFALRVPHHVRIDQTGAQITVTADGHRLTRFTDTQRPYLTGALGLYCEDSQVTFGNVHVTPLLAVGQQG